MVEKAGAVLPYDPDWPHRFGVERALLEDALAPWLAGGIHHVGSTAVPGLAAKPVIDMIAGVRDLEAARAAFEPLRTLGYRYRAHRPEAHCFHKPGGAQWWEATHHLHLTEPGSDIWRERLAFRDALRADPALVAEYQEWKVKHARGAGEPSPYAGDKRAFVGRVLAEAGVALKPDSDRLSAGALADRALDPDLGALETSRGMRGNGVLFYDEDCGFCRWCVAKVLVWDRDGSVTPLAIQSPESVALLADVEPERRLASWHFRDASGTLFSAGAAFAPLLRLLPGGSPLAAFARRYPRGVERAYRVVASNRTVLGALVTNGARARADRRLAAHTSNAPSSPR